MAAPAQHDFADWITLQRDDDTGAAAIDAQANGRLHWAPLNSAGLSQRMARIAAWIASTQPVAVVVDVSVEVTVLARLCGVPVIVLAGPGDRHDDAHQLAYGLAESVIAAWPQDVYDPPYLHPHRHKTTYVGGISRFDGLEDARRDAAGRDVFVLNGAGGTAITCADVAAAEQATPGLRWSAVGLAGQPWSEDVWTRLLDASVVVTHGGQNALADVAAARRPAVIVPQSRPFTEQVRVAAALDAAEVAVTTDAWPRAEAWSALLGRALDRGGVGWKRWSSGDGAQRAAQVISGSAR